MKDGMKRIIILAIVTWIGSITLFCTILRSFEYVFGYDPLFQEPSVRSRPNGTAGWHNMAHFSMNTDTILSALDRGEIDVFTPEVLGPSEEDAVDAVWSRTTLFPPDTISWTQADHLAVAKALNRFVWGDSLDDWSLQDMNFSTTCEAKGFTESEFRFFKTKFDRGRLSYLWRGIFLYPELGGGFWAEAEYFHPIFGWKKIDLNQAIIPAEDILRIAQEKCGERCTANTQNKCGGSLSLQPSNYDGWFVDLWSGEVGFPMFINPTTGEVIKTPK